MIDKYIDPLQPVGKPVQTDFSRAVPTLVQQRHLLFWLTGRNIPSNRDILVLYCIKENRAGREPSFADLNRRLNADNGYATACFTLLLNASKLEEVTTSDPENVVRVSGRKFVSAASEDDFYEHYYTSCGKHMESILHTLPDQTRDDLLMVLEWMIAPSKQSFAGLETLTAEDCSAMLVELLANYCALCKELGLHNVMDVALLYYGSFFDEQGVSTDGTACFAASGQDSWMNAWRRVREVRAAGDIEFCIAGARGSSTRPNYHVTEKGIERLRLIDKKWTDSLEQQARRCGVRYRDRFVAAQCVINRAYWEYALPSYIKSYCPLTPVILQGQVAAE